VSLDDDVSPSFRILNNMYSFLQNKYYTLSFLFSVHPSLFVLFIPMATTTLDAFCDDKKSRAQFSVAFARLEVVSPYGNNAYNKSMLDMRRKAEILKYGNNQSSSKTNNLSKKEKFALLTRGTGRQSAAICPNTSDSTSIIYTLSTSSGVPGPPIYLYEDATVPLYNYGAQTRSYATYTKDDVEPFSYSAIENIFIAANTFPVNPRPEFPFFYIRINPSVETIINVFTFTIPIVLSLFGNCTNLTSVPSVTFEITNPRVKIYYRDDLVPTNTTVVQFQLKDAITPVDASKFTFRPSGLGAFSAQIYIGTIEVSNLTLSTVSGFIYTANLLTVVEAKSTSGATVDLARTGLGCNNNLITEDLFINCTLQSIT
jgi:hypothetical protein